MTARVRHARPRERREQLLDATKAIVAERGFHAVSIEAVAREAGITRPIVYGHFHDLDGLLEALVDREAARALDQLVTVLPGDLGQGDPRETLLDGAARVPRSRARRPRDLAARADAARGRAGRPARPHRRAAAPRSSSTRPRRRPAASARAASRPTPSWSRARCPPSPTRARGCC